MGGAYHFYCVIRGSCAADLLPPQKLLLFFYLPLVTNCRNQLKEHKYIANTFMSVFHSHTARK